MLDVRCLKFASVWRFCYFGMETNLDHEENSSESGGKFGYCFMYILYHKCECICNRV